MPRRVAGADRDIGVALRDRVAEELVGGVDLAAIFLGGGLECVILLAERDELGALFVAQLGDGLLVDPEGTGNDE